MRRLSVSSLSLLQEVRMMAKIFYKRIIDPEDDFTLNDVPSRWRAQVARMLEDAT